MHHSVSSSFLHVSVYALSQTVRIYFALLSHFYHSIDKNKKLRSQNRVFMCNEFPCSSYTNGTIPFWWCLNCLIMMMKDYCSWKKIRAVHTRKRLNQEFFAEPKPNLRFFFAEPNWTETKPNFCAYELWFTLVPTQVDFLHRILFYDIRLTHDFVIIFIQLFNKI